MDTTRYLLSKEDILSLIRLGVQYQKELMEDTESDTPDRLFTKAKKKAEPYNLTDEDMHNALT